MKNKKVLIGIIILLVVAIGGYGVYSMTREKTKEEQLNEFFSKPPSAHEKPNKEAIDRFIGDKPNLPEGKNRANDMGSTFKNSGW